ncbi:MAG: right-handed parallel beta-helix repeat-containing protein, partial [Planctomycetales bacterium]|nr:right-handed parallel beta-helix repeat-containing protein [Planctomycetales bacterium]
GIYISNSADGAIVRNNVVWGNRASGIQFNADGSLPGDGVHSNNVIEGNIIYGNGSGGGAAINLDGVQDSLIRNNLLYDNHSTGIVLYVGFAAEPSTNNVVTNNTVVMAEDARWALLMWNGSSGNVIANNILLNRNPNRGSIDVESSSLPAYSANNILQDKFSLNGYSGSFADWQAFSGGQDVLSLVIPQTSVATELNNLFVDPSAGDFHLRAGSAAIDVGDPFHTAPTDIFGHARPSGAGIDIGAFEAGQFSPTVRFESADWIGYEFIGMAEIAVTRSGDTEQPLAVQVRSIAGITDGTASADDFQGVDGYLVFQPGESRKTFRIFIHDDAAIESREAVRLDLRVVGDPTGLFPTDQVGDPTGLIPTDQVGDPTGVGDPVGVGDPIPWIPTDQATLHLVSDDAWRPGTIEFDSRSISVNEADGVATITVRRTGGSNGEVSVDFATDDWVKPRQATWIKRHTDLLYPTDNDTPATAGEDYTAQAGTLTFADGETEKTITIDLTDDAWFEGGEAFALKLTNATGGAELGSRSSLKVHIDSDDAKQAGEFVWSAASYVVTEGTPSVNVTIERLGGGNVEAAVHLYDTGAGNGSTTASAWAGSDYAYLPWEVVFAAGEMSKTISIPIVDDGSTERDEVFSIQLYSPSNDATIGALATTQVTIQDNDSAIEFAQSNYVVNESTGVMQIKIRRIGSTA